MAFNILFKNVLFVAIVGFLGFLLPVEITARKNELACQFRIFLLIVSPKKLEFDCISDLIRYIGV